MEHWGENRTLYDRDEEGNVEESGETYELTVVSDNIDYLNFAKTRKYGETPAFRVTVPFEHGPEAFIQQNNASTIHGATVYENRETQQIKDPEMVGGCLETPESSYEFGKVADIMFQNQDIDISWFHNGEAPQEITMHLSELDDQRMQSLRQELRQYDIETDQELQLAREQIEKHTFDWYEEAQNAVDRI